MREYERSYEAGSDLRRDRDLCSSIRAFILLIPQVPPPNPVSIPEDDAGKHIDTSCYVFFRSAFFAGLKWSLIPRQLGFMDDRVFFAMLTHAGLRRVAFNQSKTVGYTCWWDSVYREAGEEPPPNCKHLEEHRAAAREWWRTLDPHSKGVIERALGLPIILPAANGASANE